MKLSHFLVSLGAVAALSGCNSKQENAANNAPVKITPVAPPKSGDWTQMVAMTPEGGFLMGNPQANVKLVEIGALTCPHCREFDEAGVPELVDKYVKSGRVSWEFRPYLLNGLDIPANLIVRCNGVNSFFPLMRAMYKDQPLWIGKIQAAPKDQVAKVQSLPPEQQFPELAKLAGLQDWAAARGVAQSRSDQCLKDAKTIDQLVQQTADVPKKYPDFPGTPTFIIDGKMFTPGTGSPLWDQLKAAMNEKLQ